MPPFADVLQWEHLPFPKSLRDFQRLFPDDDACARYLEGAKWPKGFVCPHCQEKGEPFRLATRTSVLTCRACRKQTSLTVGTVMQRTHSPLTVWFWACYLVSSLTPGMSAVQFQRQLGLSRYVKARDRGTNTGDFGFEHIPVTWYEHTLEKGAQINSDRAGVKTMTYSTIYDLDGNTIADGVQSQKVCDATINTARRIAREDGRSVIVEDRGTEECYRVTPAGHIWRVPRNWGPPGWVAKGEG